MQKENSLGELWDRVKLPNGMIGYVFQNYLRELPDVQIESIDVSIPNGVMKKGESQKLSVKILPEEAKDHEIEYSSSNERIVNVDSEGNILALKSGTATIQVKARENNVSGSVEVQVYTPVTDMQINTESLVMQEGERFMVMPILFPTDADNQKVEYASNNEQVATVDGLGNIVAVKVGNTKVIVKTEDGGITKEILVTVVPKLTEGEIIFNKDLKVEQNEISGWNTEELKVDSIKDKIHTSYKIEVCNAKGEELTDEQMAGTGSKIRIVGENDEIRMEYYMILYGDVNGDAKINSLDLLVLQRHILEIEKLKGVFLKAGNINKNGKNPSSLDLLMIQRHILMLKLIEQR